MVQGYLAGDVKVQKEIKKKKLKANYMLHPGRPYIVNSIKLEIEDSIIRNILLKDSVETLLSEGMVFNSNILDGERSRINAKLQNLGYFQFNKEYITYQADTVRGTYKVDLTMRLRNPQRASHHTSFTLGNINLITSQNSSRNLSALPVDSLNYYGLNIYYDGNLLFRPKILSDNVQLESGDLYSLSKVQQTYDNFNRMKAFKYTSINMQVSPSDSTLLNAYIMTEYSRFRSVSAELEGTNSAGDLGAAASLTFSHRNLFRGSETWAVKLRGAYEAITGLEGYTNQNYLEWGLETSINFPRFLFPFLSRNFRHNIKASSEVSVQYDMQNRPEFRRRVATAAWRYRWAKLNDKFSHRFDLLDISFISMPWISSTFKETYLDNLTEYNAILKYNYEDLFIMKLGYSFVYNSMGLSGNTGSNSGTNSYTIRANIETAGNLLQGINKVFNGTKNSSGSYTVFNIAFAQYIKGDFDISKSVRFDERNSLAIHAGLGVAYPYGNANMLPFEKRYFSGGANSVRGWNVRSLGPGTYKGLDRNIDYINQSGDIKIDLNLEYRTHLFWKIDGAIFIDAGNIWTIRNYRDQPGGQFKFTEFYKQLAASYGIGLRLVFDYFILRFDGGMKAVNPAYAKGKQHYPLIDPHWGRDFTFHFAVGLPF
jgi:outer membrane protein assembly factor BamA